MLQQALIELRAEFSARPSRLKIPLQEILQLLDSEKTALSPRDKFHVTQVPLLLIEIQLDRS